MAAIPGLHSMASLRSAEQIQLLDLVDSLCAEGLSEFTALPQLIVCGDQSSGKSSLLEAISGVPFPRKDNLCTRFATEVILRRASVSEIRVSLVGLSIFLAVWYWGDIGTRERSIVSRSGSALAVSIRSHLPRRLQYPLWASQRCYGTFIHRGERIHWRHSSSWDLRGDIYTQSFALNSASIRGIWFDDPQINKMKALEAVTWKS